MSQKAGDIGWAVLLFAAGVLALLGSVMVIRLGYLALHRGQYHPAEFRVQNVTRSSSQRNLRRFWIAEGLIGERKEQLSPLNGPDRSIPPVKSGDVLSVLHNPRAADIFVGGYSLRVLPATENLQNMGARTGLAMVGFYLPLTVLITGRFVARSKRARVVY